MVCELRIKFLLFPVICYNRYLLLSDLLYPFVQAPVHMSTEVTYSERETVLFEVVWE